MLEPVIPATPPATPEASPEASHEPAEVIFDGPLGEARGAAALSTILSFLTDPLRGIEKAVQRHGRNAGLFLPSLGRGGAPMALLFCAPETNRAFLTLKDAYAPLGLWGLEGRRNSALRRLADGDPLAARGARWESFSRYYRPLFARERLTGLRPRADAIIADEIAGWPRDTVFDALAAAKRLTQRLAFDLMLGEPDRDKAHEMARLLERCHATARAPGVRIPQPLLRGLPLERAHCAAAELFATLDTWMDGHRADPARGDIVSLARHAPPGDTADAIEFASALAAFAWAAFETSATTISWALMLLALNPGIARNAAADLGADPDGAGRRAVECIVNETLRLFAPVPIQTFENLRPLEVSGYRLTPGTRFFLSAHVTHRDETLYPDPHRFRPERWRRIERTGYEFMPFSAGPRRCPGSAFASANVQSAIAEVLRHAFPAVPQGTRVDLGYASVIYPKPDLRLMLTRTGAAGPAPAIEGTVLDHFDATPAAVGSDLGAGPQRH